MKTPFKVVIILFIFVMCFFGCARREKHEADSKDRYRETRILLGTIVRVDVCGDPATHLELENIYQEIWQRLKDIHWRMSYFDDRSDVSRINRSFNNPVFVGCDTYQLIKDAKKYSKMTQGTFDITVLPLVQLWESAGLKGVNPTLAEVRRVKGKIGMDRILLHENCQVEIVSADVQIDLSALAKGYAVDEAAAIFRKYGVKDFFIDAGGDIYVGGHNCEGDLWRIGIRSPENKEKILKVVHVKDAAVTTSGDYEKFSIIGDQKWSHIINPITGYPRQSVNSATVIAPTAREADALSTALCILPPNKGVVLVDHLEEGYAALLVNSADQKNPVLPSRNLQRFQKK
ncbi:MAG: FAD:protein FMN transferase [Candidatus Omnitrophica bacterium]|nr:FAD:protein FMN transferase [Candidatus Omnitrophota bacterium]